MVSGHSRHQGPGGAPEQTQRIPHPRRLRSHIFGPEVLESTKPDSQTTTHRINKLIGASKKMTQAGKCTCDDADMKRR